MTSGPRLITDCGIFIPAARAADGLMINFVFVKDWIGILAGLSPRMMLTATRRQPFRHHDSPAPESPPRHQAPEIFETRTPATWPSSPPARCSQTKPHLRDPLPLTPFRWSQSEISSTPEQRAMRTTPRETLDSCPHNVSQISPVSLKRTHDSSLILLREKKFLPDWKAFFR